MQRYQFIVRNRSKNPNKKTTIYISMHFSHSNYKMMYPTPLKVEYKNWNNDLGRTRKTMFYHDGTVIDAAVQKTESFLTKFMSEAAMNGTPITKDSVKEALDNFFGKNKKVNDDVESNVASEEIMDFHKFFEKYIEVSKTRMNEKRGGQTMSYSTLREYANIYKQIKDFEAKEGIYLQFEDINQDFMNKFVAYLQNLNLSTNTIGQKIMQIKAVMKRAYEQDLTTNTKFQFVKRQSESADNVALSEEELHQIVDLDLSNNPRLARTRDLFLVGCWTGLRFSDVSKLRKEHIDNDIIKITQTKTNSDVYIPLHPLVKQILEQYDYNLPQIRIQKFNYNIKEVCKLAEINKPFIKSITRGGKKVSTVYPKWQVVSSHTARRSFATNLYLSGFPSISIMAITGHKSESAFLSYIKVSRAEHAKRLADYWKKNSAFHLTE